MKIKSDDKMKKCDNKSEGSKHRLHKFSSEVKQLLQTVHGEEMCVLAQ